MDQLGFGLENFDAIGRWRDKDGEFAIDASGELPGGGKFNGPLDLAKVLDKRRRRVRPLPDRKNAHVRPRPRTCACKTAVRSIR